MDISHTKGLNYDNKRAEARDQLKTQAKLLTTGPDSLTYQEIKNLSRWNIFRSPLFDAKLGSLDYKQFRKLIAEDCRNRGKPYHKSELKFDRIAE